MKKKTALKLLFIGIATLTVVVSAIAVNAYVIKKSGGMYNPPVYVKCSSSFSQATLTAVHNACSMWNNAHGSALVYRNTATHNNTTFPCQNGVNEITKGKRSSEKYLMATKYVVYDTVYAYEADIDINTVFDFGTASTSYDTQSVMLHELGHFLGLGDTTDKNTCMYGKINPGEKHGLYQDDINGINEIYR